MAKITLPDITSGYYSTTALNTAFADIEAAIENTVSRDGTTPNNMSGDLDMNSNRITNLPEPLNLNEAARLQDVINASNGDLAANLITATATTYNLGTTVQEHLNNLGEATGAASVGNTPAGSIASTTVQAALNELDSEKQPIDATLTALAGTLTAANKVPYATALDTASELDFLDEDNMASDSATALASQQSIKAYADTKNIATQVVPTTAGNVLFTTNGTTWTSVPKITSSTAVATTSGSQVDFTSIPSWVKRITMMFVGVSFAAAGIARIRIGTGGTLTTTGYVGSLYALTTTPSIVVTALSTAPEGIGGFVTAAAGSSFEGKIILVKQDGNTWCGDTSGVRVGDSIFHQSSGSITLAGPLDIISLVATTSTFDAGSVNITYE